MKQYPYIKKVDTMTDEIETNEPRNPNSTLSWKPGLLMIVLATAVGGTLLVPILAQKEEAEELRQKEMMAMEELAPNTPMMSSVGEIFCRSARIEPGSADIYDKAVLTYATDTRAVDIDGQQFRVDCSKFVPQ